MSGRNIYYFGMGGEAVTEGMRNTLGGKGAAPVDLYERTVILPMGEPGEGGQN